MRGLVVLAAVALAAQAGISAAARGEDDLPARVGRGAPSPIPTTGVRRVQPRATSVPPRTAQVRSAVPSMAGPQTSSAPAPGATIPPASYSQYSSTIRSRVPSRPLVRPAQQPQDQAIDLGAATPPSSSQEPSGAMGQNVGEAHRLLGLAPNFKIYFDFDLVNRPGIQDLTFENYHSYFFYEILPDSKLQFSFDINPSPRFYELDYEILPRVQLRFGKIWIPFDDTSPHNIYGGRVNTSRLSLQAYSPSHNVFLPDLWTDLGVGLKWTLIDTPTVAGTLDVYVVNGFASGGTDPLGNGNPYPNFSDVAISAVDNNRNKSIGGRFHATLFGMFSGGISYYTGNWSDETLQPGLGISILGLDGQVRIGGTELRAGLASMKVSLLEGTANRGGDYFELGQRFGGNRQWKFMLRAGTIQLDDRVIDVTDQTLVGATLLWHPNLIEYSLEFSRDLKDSPNKPGLSYAAARVIIAL